MLRTFNRATGVCKSGDLPAVLSAPLGFSISTAHLRFVFWTVVSLAFISVAFLLDPAMERLLRLEPSTLVDRLAWYISRTGEGWVVALAGATGWLLFLTRQQYRAGRAALAIATTGLLTGAVATILRSLLGRTRPNVHELQGFYGVWHDSHWIIGKYEFGAFPSGHAATVIGVAAAAWLIDRRLGVLAAVYAALVTWSRIALGCHHFSDTIAAAVVGIFGAQLIFPRLGPGVNWIRSHLHNDRVDRKGVLPSSG